MTEYIINNFSQSPEREECSLSAIAMLPSLTCLLPQGPGMRRSGTELVRKFYSRFVLREVPGVVGTDGKGGYLKHVWRQCQE